MLLAQDIWDAIALENDKLPLPEWQKSELDKRYNQYKQGKLELFDWQEVHNQLRKSH
ncbi:MAG: addiction module protein [Pseudomonadota bacterium]